ncbi:hypothetical protein [Aestuariivirga sp.]|jgi:hypothetical protein|uniref:hypothetical protein n=1 Tax=Aestuariivirga sp. TaxID=2650926 RepID=UPI0037844F37
MTTITPKIRQKVLTVDAKLLGSTPVVIAIAVSGAKYQLRHSFASLAAAERVADKVAAKGTIDEQHWDVVGVQPQSRAAAHLQVKACAEAQRLEAAREMRLAA